MSAVNPKLNTPIRKPATVHPAIRFVDANSLLQNVVQKLSSDVRNSIILRCDELPQVQGTKENIENAFTQLLEMIVEKKPTDTKLFLYVTCNGEDDGQFKTGHRRFQIQFHTNLTLHAEWMQEAEHHVNSIASLLLPFGGRFTVNQLKNSGCIFSISLPGKQ